MRNVNVTDFEAGSLPVEAARAERRQPAFVGQHRERIGLVNNLREFASAEEVLNRCRDTLWIDQRAGSHLGDILEAHPLLDGPAEFQEALPQFVAGQFINGSQSPVAEVINVIDLDRFAVAVHQFEQVANCSDQILSTQRHFGFRHGEPEFPIDAEATDAAQPVPVGVLELLIEQGDCLVERGRIARPQPLIDPDQGVLMAGRHCRSFPRLVSVFPQAVLNQRRLVGLHDFNCLQAGRADQLRLVPRDRAASLHQNFASPVTSLGVDDVVGRNLALKF